MCRTAITLTLLGLLLLAAPVFGAGDYVDVPAEYYFGRWAQGHYGTAYGTLRDDRDPIWKTGYGFASNSFRVSVPRLEQSGLWDISCDSVRIAPLSVWWRPGGKWQLGITDYTYFRKESSGIKLSNSSMGRSQLDRSSFGLPVAYVSADTMRLLTHQAQYSYYVTDIAPAGRFMLQSNMDWKLQRTDGYYTNVQTVYGEVERQESQSFRWDQAEVDAEVSGTYGLTQDINLAGRFTYRAYGDRHKTWTETVYPNQTFDMIQNNRANYNYASSYRIDVRARTWGSLWTRAGLYRDYRWYVYEESEGGISSAGVVPTEYTRSTWSNSPYVTSLRFGVDYLSLKGFDSQMLIDDYQDYYGHLLGERQWYAQFLFVVDWYDTQDDRLTLHYLVRNGWSDHFEVGLSGGYSVAEREYNHDLIQRSLSMELQVRWRTYRYEPGKGPGWERDSRYDVAFGTMPRAGHWFGTFATNVFNATDPRSIDANPIAFWDLKYDIGFEYYTLTHRLGLGRQIALEATQRIDFAGESLGKLHIDRHYYTVGAVARPLPMVEVSATLQDVFYYNGYDYTAEWRVAVQALL